MSKKSNSSQLFSLNPILTLLEVKIPLPVENLHLTDVGDGIVWIVCERFWPRGRWWCGSLLSIKVKGGGLEVEASGAWGREATRNQTLLPGRNLRPGQFYLAWLSRPAETVASTIRRGQASPGQRRGSLEFQILHLSCQKKAERSHPKFRLKWKR